MFASICASVTASTGGVSNMMMSYCCFASLISDCIILEPSSSDGFGGIGPDDMMSRLSILLASAIWFKRSEERRVGQDSRSLYTPFDLTNIAKEYSIS